MLMIMKQPLWSLGVIIRVYEKPPIKVDVWATAVPVLTLVGVLAVVGWWVNTGRGIHP
jgi:hypothetical protein